MMDVLNKMQRSKTDSEAVMESELDDIVNQIGEASMITASGNGQNAGDGDEDRGAGWGRGKRLEGGNVCGAYWKECNCGRIRTFE